MKINLKIIRRMVLFLILGILSIFCTPNMLRGQNLEIEQNNALIMYKNEFPYEDNYFTSKIIRGQKLINEIDNYYIINNDYPKCNAYAELGVFKPS